MTGFSTPAILLRRIDFRDYDLIITFFTLNRGRINVIAKYAKKSVKRFQGVLEPFSFLHLVCSTGAKNRLPVLQEAAIKNPFYSIRLDIEKTAYASYWVELIDRWMEKNEKQTTLFYLLLYVLEKLDRDNAVKEVLSILFQMRFMTISGMNPNFSFCSGCKIGIDKIKNSQIYFDLSRGGIVCERCAIKKKLKISLSKGTIKQLLWIENRKFSTAKKIRLSSLAIKEGLLFLEAFVPYHLGTEPKSLKFLRQIREGLEFDG